MIARFSCPRTAHSGATISTPLSTTAATLSLNARFEHSTSSVSSHTVATCLSTLISRPGTGTPSECRRRSSAVSSSVRSSGLAVLPLLAVSSTFSGEAGVDDVVEKSFGRGMGVMVGPNCVSRIRSSRSRRSVGLTLACGCGRFGSS